MKMLHSPGRGAIAIVLGAVLILSLVAPASAREPVRPFLGHATGMDSLVAATAACPAGSMWFVTENGTGYFTHLGRVQYTFEQCAAANLATGEGWTTGKGSMTILVASGDRLTLSYEATFQATPMPIPTTADVHLDWVVTGGTGRFVAATGSGEASLAVAYTPDLTGAVSASLWHGTVAY